MFKPIRLVVADDHPIMREGLAALLEDGPDFKVVGRASSGREAIALIRRHRPDIAILDIAMDDMTGLEVARRLSPELPEVNMMILTMYEEEAFFIEALRAGAVGYVLKGINSEQLFSAIRAVSTGGFYMPPKFVGRLAHEYLEYQSEPRLAEPLLPPECDIPTLMTQSLTKSIANPLSPREREVLTLIAQGFTNSDIAARLTLTLNTVKTHRLHIYRKLNLHDRADLFNYALNHGLLYS